MFDVAPTPLDLNFRLLGFPVRVSPWFWLVTALFGFQVSRNAPPAALPLWVGCVFVSILLHELGHALLFRRYGAWAVRVILHGFGGVAIADRLPMSRGKRILVALAGPGAQFLLAGVVVGSDLLLDWQRTNELTVLIYAYLKYINLVWALVNLLPIMPLDGGQVCLNLFALLKLPRAEVKAWGVSAVTAGLLVVVSVLHELGRLPPAVAERLPFTLSWFGIFFVGLLAVQSFQQMQRLNRTYAWDDDSFRGGRRRW